MFNNLLLKSISSLCVTRMRPDWMSNAGLVFQYTQLYDEMKKTLRDKAVTNQSHRKTLKTVKDISGQSSHALVMRGRAVTTNSHAALFTVRSGRKALAILYPVSFQPCSFPTLSLSFLSSSRHAPSCLWRPDSGTRAALIGVDRWLCAAKAPGVTAKPVWPVVVTKANSRPKHRRFNPKPHHSCQHAKMSINTGTFQIFRFPSVSVLCSFHPALLLTSVFNSPRIPCYLPVSFKPPTLPLSYNGPQLTS